MESIFTEDGVPPIGPYSQAIKANGTIYVSGQIPADNKGKLIDGTVADMTHKMCQNAATVLKAAGSSLDKTVKVTVWVFPTLPLHSAVLTSGDQQVYFADLDDFKEMNDVYALYFPHKPARSAIEAKRIPAGARMEMDLIALA